MRAPRVNVTRVTAYRSARLKPVWCSSHERWVILYSLCILCFYFRNSTVC